VGAGQFPILICREFGIGARSIGCLVAGMVAVGGLDHDTGLGIDCGAT
jgi:hypothetical protein